MRNDDDLFANPGSEHPTQGEESELYVLRATSEDGYSILAGPVDIIEGLALTDQYLAPNRWKPDYLSILPVSRAIKVWTVVRHSQFPNEAADLFVALRRAIICNPEHDGIEDRTVQALIRHLEPHRPMQMWTGDEECLLGECDHPRRPDGGCVNIAPVERLCRACTPIIEIGGEYGPDIPDSCRILWPCVVLTTVAQHYNLTSEGAPGA